MRKPIYCVYDNVAKMYLTPIFSEPQDGVAVRTVQTTMENKEHPFSKHPSDYTLVRLGMFDEEQGQINQDSKADIIELEKLASGE